MEDVLIRFRLVDNEARALNEWSAREFRHPRDQVKFVIRRELERLGLLQPASTTLQAELSKEAEHAPGH